MSAVCHTCKRGLLAGEPAWASDWIILAEDGPRGEIRYTCDDCEAKA